MLLSTNIILSLKPTFQDYLYFILSEHIFATSPVKKPEMANGDDLLRRETT